MMKKDISKTLSVIEKYTSRYTLPFAEIAKEWYADPFKILVSVMISSRTKDEVTAQAAKRLFSKARKMADIEKISADEIGGLICPVNFYKTKSMRIKEIARIIREDFNGKVPDTIEELVTLPGIGRKTANIVVSVAFNKSSIGVDTHVHRIMNRLGFVKTKTPLETEMCLRKIVPKKSWRNINPSLVLFGKNVCVPVSPFCSSCPVRESCRQVGVKRSR
jgi:endonuclease III